MGGALLLACASLRAAIRAGCIQKTSPTRLEKVLAAIIITPLFALVLVILRIASALKMDTEVEARTFTGGRFICRPPDLIQLYIWLFGVWEPDLTAFIRSRLKQGDGFIDVGANIGYYTVLARRCVGPSGQVAAIEAAPDVFRALQATIALNQCGENVRLVNKAASAVAGEVSVYAGPAHNTGLTTTVGGRGLLAVCRVEARALDDLVTQAERNGARLVKIDVEGGEADVLAGMQAFLRGGRDDVEILVELSPGWWDDKSRSVAEVLRPFVGAGFHTYALPNSYWPWRYFWPMSVSRPQRVSLEAVARAKRTDLVLSRLDADEL